MKKTEELKMSFAPLMANKGAVQSGAPANPVQQAQPFLNSDPSSTFRSSRYPVPQFDTRIGAAQ